MLKKPQEAEINMDRCQSQLTLAWKSINHHPQHGGRNIMTKARAPVLSLIMCPDKAWLRHLPARQRYFQWTRFMKPHVHIASVSFHNAREINWIISSAEKRRWHRETSENDRSHVGLSFAWVLSSPFQFLNISPTSAHKISGDVIRQF